MYNYLICYNLLCYLFIAINKKVAIKVNSAYGYYEACSCTPLKTHEWYQCTDLHNPTLRLT